MSGRSTLIFVHEMWSESTLISKNPHFSSMIFRLQLVCLLLDQIKNVKNVFLFSSSQSSFRLHDSFSIIRPSSWSQYDNYTGLTPKTVISRTTHKWGIMLFPVFSALGLVLVYIVMRSLWPNFAPDCPHPYWCGSFKKETLVN